MLKNIKTILLDLLMHYKLLCVGFTFQGVYGSLSHLPHIEFRVYVYCELHNVLQNWHAQPKFCWGTDGYIHTCGECTCYSPQISTTKGENHRNRHIRRNM